MLCVKVDISQVCSSKEQKINHDFIPTALSIGLVQLGYIKEIKAPQSIPYTERLLFLAGSIEMGAAENWQDRVVKELKDTKWTLLNPRRENWDSSWVQRIKNEQFAEQVGWELSGMEAAEKILMYFDPNTKSPITLLELGLNAREFGKLMICCPDGFWRKGNVEMVCSRYKIPLATNLEKFIGQLQTDL